MNKQETQLLVAMRNAEAIAQTLVEHGKRLDQLNDLIVNLQGGMQAIQQEIQVNKAQIHNALRQTYGNGPTA